MRIEERTTGLLSLPLATFLVLALVAVGCVSPGQMFRRNAELKAEGYYQAEFEFKMEAALYHLNQGHYWKAYRTLRQIDHELESKEGLEKIPPETSPDQLMDFLLNRQNPKTGAFMDPSYPYFTFIGPTANVLGTLDTLSTQTGRPVKLHSPLHFLDEINSPKQLKEYLESLLYFQERWAEKFGGPTPFCPGVSELSADSLDLFERVGGYQFAQDWKETLIQWLADHQDPKSGFWGARIGTPEKWRQALDIDSTAHILKLFLDERGEVKDPRFPLQYADQLAQTLIEQADTPVPDGATEQHEWSLRQLHAAKIFVRYLWPRISAETKERFLALAPSWMERRFSLFRPEQHGFAIDALSPKADIDATGMGIGLLRHLGCIPGTWERQRLRGEALSNAPQLSQVLLKRWEDALFPDRADVNSVRVYIDVAPEPETLDDSTLVQIFYPKKTPILDLQDLRQHVGLFLEADGGEVGNWDSKASLREGPLGLSTNAREIQIAQGPLLLKDLAARYPEAKRFVAVGLDRFQTPLLLIEFTLENAQ